MICGQRDFSPKISMNVVFEGVWFEIDLVPERESLGTLELPAGKLQR